MVELLIVCLVYVFEVYPILRIIRHVREGDDNGTSIFVVH